MGNVEGMTTCEYLWDKKKVVPFLKSDVGLAPKADGVQMMKEHPGLEDMLDRGLAKGCWGTKQRSQIQELNAEGIKKLVIAGLEKLKPEDKVIFKLTLPEKANLYQPLMKYPQVVRVVALSGGYDLTESNKRLSENNGMIASFSRTLREGLHKSQTDEEFTKTLGGTIDKVVAASRT